MENATCFQKYILIFLNIFYSIFTVLFICILFESSHWPFRSPILDVLNGFFFLFDGLYDFDTASLISREFLQIAVLHF